MDGDRLWNCHGFPARASQTNREVGVLSVEQDTFIEPRNLLPRGTTVGAPSSERPYDQRAGRCRLGYRATAQPREPCQRSIRRHADAVDRLFVGLDEER